MSKAYRKGRQARRDGKPLTANPYKREDFQRKWDDGWYAEDVAATEATENTTPTVIVTHEPQVTTQTMTSQPASYYYRNPPIPCPECGEVRCQPPIEHRQAVVAIKSNRWQAFMHCRVCEHKFVLPVKYPPHG